MGTIQPTLDKIIAPLSKDMAVRLVTRAKKKASPAACITGCRKAKSWMFLQRCVLGLSYVPITLPSQQMP